VVAPHPRRQNTHTPLDSPRVGQRRIDQFDRDLPGQLTQVAATNTAAQHDDVGVAELDTATPR
jgi:hypothetical protein